MRYCQNCDRDYSDKYFRKHCRNNIHLRKTYGVKNIYRTENILVKEINNTFSNIVKKHKRKFHSFLIVCKINNRKIFGRVLLKYYNKDDMVKVEFNFSSKREDMAFNYYISRPKPMLETLMIKNLDKYPKKFKNI